MSEETPFLYADQLNITAAEYDALMEVRGYFENNLIIHDPEHLLDKTLGFNMSIAMDLNGACSAGCIGGWMWVVLRKNRQVKWKMGYQYVRLGEHSKALTPLFYPESDDWYIPPLEHITPAMALKAIDNFLMTGDPDWPEVCAEDESPTEELASS